MNSIKQHFETDQDICVENMMVSLFGEKLSEWTTLHGDQLC